MGEFSLRCILTGTYITRDDEIVAIPVEFGHDSFGPQHTCKSTDLFKPCGLPMFGVYDEYGGITVHENDAGAKFNAELFHTDVNDIGTKFHGAVVEKKRLCYYLHDRDWKIVEVKLPDTATDAEKFRAWIDRSEMLHVGLAIMHKKAWEEGLKRGYRRPYETLMNAAFINNAVSRLKALPPVTDAEEFAEHGVYRFDQKGIKLTQEEELSVRSICADRDFLTYPIHQLLKRKFAEILDKDVNHDDIFNLTFALFAIHAFMNCYGFIWKGTNSIGQQNPRVDDLKSELEWLNMTAKMVKDRIKYMKSQGY
jgi:hypothetical protein